MDKRLVLTDDEIAMMTQGMTESDAMRFIFEHGAKTQEEQAITKVNKTKFKNELKKQIEKQTNK